MQHVALRVASHTFEGGRSMSVTAPWTGDELARVALAEPEHAERATLAAQQAFGQLQSLRRDERAHWLRSIAERIEHHREALSRLIAEEAGKPITHARAEVARAAHTFALGAQAALDVMGEVIPLDVTPHSHGARGYWQHVARGPVLAFAPFNFPLNLVAHKLSPALACGSSVVLKPPPQAPLTALRLATLIQEAGAAIGAPADAVQVVPCDVDLAERLVRDDRFGTLSFTGSSKVGWYLRSIAGKKHTILELGGNAAVLVHDDTRVADTALRVATSAFGYAGQVCIKTQRAYVHDSIAESWLDELVGYAHAMQPSDPLQEATVLGSLIDEAAAMRVESWVNEALAAGARLLCGGRREGNRYWPTVLAVEGDGAGLRVVDEEVFGPVLTVHTYSSWEQALRMADRSRYGLQAGIFTDSHARIEQAWSSLNVGGLIVNDVPGFRVDSMPYGGVRDSGIGREGVRFAMREMMSTKLMVYR